MPLWGIADPNDVGRLPGIPKTDTLPVEPAPTIAFANGRRGGYTNRAERLLGELRR